VTFQPNPTRILILNHPYLPWPAIQVLKWMRGRGWRRRRLRRPARVERGETFSGWRENGALAPGSRCHPSQEIRSVVGSYHGCFFCSQLGSRSISLLVGCDRRKINGSVSGGVFGCDETKKNLPVFMLTLLQPLHSFRIPPECEELTTDDQRLHLRRLKKTCS
jgi:hypothetical protein